MWSAIEVAPGRYDWADYDRQLELAADNGISTVIAEMVTAAPEWAFRKHAGARLEARDGSKAHSAMGGSSATGGFPGLCLDDPDVRDLAGRFLRELATRYKGHPALGGYDVWNECNFPAAYCYCPATAERFREWLRGKYGQLSALARAWHRYSLADWADVQPPRHQGAYPDVLDWLQFRIDNGYAKLRWRVELIRSIDPGVPVTAHGVALTLSSHADGGADEWRAAAEVDSYGFTWVASRRGNEPWKQWHAVDLVRGGSRGKAFWHAEAQAGPLWMQPQVTGRPRDDGRIAEPEDVRLWNKVSFAGGATGYLYPRWRPLLDGPLFGAFGAYGMDGSRTPRSEMVSQLAQWVTAPERRELWAARPVRGELGILFAPESQLFCHAQQGSTDFYARSARGAYQGFFDQNVQSDWVRIDHVDEYRVLYVPFPVMLDDGTIAALIRWVERGGLLVSEGCPGYFGAGGRAGQLQPNRGLQELFGARESYVEFTPDILGDLTFELAGRQVPGGIFLQAYESTTGRAAGHYPDGRVAVVDHAAGRGRTRLIGTFPGFGYFERPAPGFFEEVVAWAGVEPRVRVDTAGVVARLHEGEGRTFLWLVNHNRDPVRVRYQVRGAQSGEIDVDGRDAEVVRLAGETA